MVLNVELLRRNIFIKCWGVVKMRMLRLKSVNMKKDRIWDEDVLLKIKVVPINEKRWGKVIWDGLVIFRGELLMHQWERVSWINLREQKKNVEEDQK